MPQIINTNVMSLNSQRNLNKSQRGLATALNRLSSGLRINSAKDDAAGLAISERFTSQIKGLSQAARNANDGISLSQTAEGALGEVSTMLQRIRELAIQSANSTNSSSDRLALQNEVVELKNEIERISSTTSFNGTNLLNGDFGNGRFQVGANANQTINVSINSTSTSTMGAYRLQGFDGPNIDANASSVNGATAATGTQFTITGPDSDGTASAIVYAANTDAFTIASQINDATGNSGVSAEAYTKLEIGGAANGFTDGAISFNLFGKNSSASVINAVISGGGTGSGLNALVSSINTVSATTGVTARADSDAIILEQADGYDITITNMQAQGDVDMAAYLGDSDTLSAGGVATMTSSGGAGTVMGRLSLYAESGFSVVDLNSEVFGTTTSTSAGTLQQAADIDVGSISGSNDAIHVIDAAIGHVNGIRAQLGALQSRFESTISNLQTSVENLSAARSRIQDADFAAETAELTRTQILQQAGTAMLAQANSIPQNVLSLLG